ncbi:hypothetical protein BDF14DRAFT_1754717 [Spinellus fusiger]|nr:hypothetical protein BDF14DRAFT_1754717 [Spinellus fusiger]
MDMPLSLGPPDFKFCEDMVPSTTEKNIVYVACDPMRDRINKVMNIYLTEDLLAIETGSVWRVNYTDGQIEKLKIKGSPKVANDLHTLGIALDVHGDQHTTRAFVVNLPDQAPSGVEVFGVQASTDASGTKELVHLKTITHPLLATPNSVHPFHDNRFRGPDGTPSFFVSNDHYFYNPFLKMFENYLLLPITNVLFYDARVGTFYPVAKGLVFANGLAGDDSVLFVSETNLRSVRQYTIHVVENKQGDGKPGIVLEYVNSKAFPLATDNLRYDSQTQELLVSGHPHGLQLLAYVKSKNKKGMRPPPMRVMAWDLQKDNVNELLTDTGAIYGASTTALRDAAQHLLVVTSLVDHGLLVCPDKH